VTEGELALGVHSKRLGQMRLVLFGRSLISEGGSFTLMSGYVLDDPIPEATGFAVASGGVEGFVRAAALGLERRVRINAVSPGLARDTTSGSSGPCPRFDAGDRVRLSAKHRGVADRRDHPGMVSGPLRRAPAARLRTPSVGRRTRTERARGQPPTIVLARRG
jgi:NAD(P)-dependent dehydrogenase (short-subunit alcohol dehydrogenase family)